MFAESYGIIIVITDYKFVEKYLLGLPSSIGFLQYSQIYIA